MRHYIKYQEVLSYKCITLFPLIFQPIFYYNFHYTVSSNEVNITPAFQTAFTGKIVFIHCYSKIVPLWDKDGRKYIGYNSTLVLYSVKNEDTGMYYCYGVDSQGIAFIAVSRLIVAGKFGLIIGASEVVCSSNPTN